MVFTGQCILGGVSYSLSEHEVMSRPAGVTDRTLGSIKGGAAFSYCIALVTKATITINCEFANASPLPTTCDPYSDL